MNALGCASCSEGNDYQIFLYSQVQSGRLMGIEPGNEVPLKVTGKLYDGTTFEGGDKIREIDKGKG